MKFNPDIHHRKSIRLKEYDYTQPGVYFVTICTQNRECLFGDVTDGQMQLNDKGKIVEECWAGLNKRFPQIQLDISIIMPNHFHGIIFINDVENGIGRRGGDPPAPNLAQWEGTDPLHSIKPNPGTDTYPIKSNERAGGSPPLQKFNLGHIVAQFKYQTTKQLNQENEPPWPRIWQRNYYEHVVRTDDELNRIREYIRFNPNNWDQDPENPWAGNMACVPG